MSDAPKRIWAHITSGKRKCVISFDYPSLEYPIEYIRKDIHDAAVSKARVDALREAADHLLKLAQETPIGHENAQRGSSTYNWLRHHRDEILTLIEKEPKP